MTLINALPKTENGCVLIPYGMKQGDKYFPCAVDQNWLKLNLPDFVNKEVPLLDVDYQALLDASTEIWRLNWQHFRDQGII